MSLSTLHYSLIYACLLAFNHPALAEVYDFGNIQAFNSPPFSQLPLTDTRSETQYRQEKYNTLSGKDWGTWHGSGLSDNALNNLYDMAQSGVAEPAAPAAAMTSYAPEPESYAMIVAGLGLIVFTARHRK